MKRNRSVQDSSVILFLFDSNSMNLCNIQSKVMSKKNSKLLEQLDEQKKKTELREMKNNDPALLKEDIFLLKQQLQDILRKQQEIQMQIQNNQSAYTKEVYELEKELKAQEQVCVDFENKLAEFNQMANYQMEKMKQTKSVEFDEFKKKKDEQKDVVHRQRKILEDKLEYLKQYPQRKKKYLDTVLQLNEQTEKMIKSQQKDLKNIRNEHQRNRTKLGQETKDQMEKIKTKEVNRVEKKMTKDLYIKRENEVIQQEIKLCEQQKSALATECHEMNAQMQSSKVKNNYETVLGNQAGDTYERSLRIIKLQGKLSKLKSYLTEQSAKMQKEYENLDKVYSKQYQDLEAKISKVEGWIRMKERDLKKVKACSQMVLNQRSHLQCYLLQVFYEHPDLDYKNPEQISQILRYLFAKINSKKPPLTYKNYLMHSQNSMASSSSKI